MQLKSGTLLKGGEYKIEKVLGQGGFGITYLAVQTALDRKVAIKEFFMKEYCERSIDTSAVSMGTSGSKELVCKFRNKFIREAKMIAAMENPHIVTIYEVFEENGTAYYVMQYVEGGSLESKVPMKPDEAEIYIRQIADALDYCHDQKILHLDVKPSNVMLNKGKAVLIDFGISKHYDEGGGQTSSTPVGISKGYAPLEQYDRGDISSFTPCTDIYSLGATFYKLLTGQTPPEANKVNEEGIHIPDNIPTNQRHAITFSMQPKRKDRPQSVGEFLAVLESKTPPKEDTYVEVKVKVDPEPEPAPAPVPVPAPHPLPKRNWMILVIMVVVLGFGGYYAYDVIENKKAEAARLEKEKKEREEREAARLEKERKECEEREAAQIAQAQKETMLSDKQKYLSLIGEGDKLQQQKKYSESINKYKQAQVYEEKYSSTVYSGEFDEGASAKIRAAEETERRYNEQLEREAAAKAEAARLEKEKREREAAERAKYNGHDWVDLGLSVKWATCNVGAESPEDYGNYYAWGETSTKSEYTEDNSKTEGKQMNDIGGRSQYDVARSNWGGSWRLPTEAELEELKYKCTWTWTTQNGVKGCKVTGPNGNSIFLPAAGVRGGSSLYSAGELGYYWGSALNESDSDYAYYLLFNSDFPCVHWSYRYFGQSVRPVSE